MKAAAIALPRFQTRLWPYAGGVIGLVALASIPEIELAVLYLIAAFVRIIRPTGLFGTA